MVEESTLLFICSSRFEPNNQGDNVVSDLFGSSSVKDLSSFVKHPWNHFGNGCLKIEKQNLLHKETVGLS